jgi:hypothetical protein
MKNATALHKHVRDLVLKSLEDSNSQAEDHNAKGEKRDQNDA